MHLIPIIVALGACFIVAATPAAETFPQRPIRLVVPTGAGGNTDTFARVLAERLREPRFANSRYVWSYRDHPVCFGLRVRLLEIIDEEGPLRLGRLLTSIRSDRDPAPAVLALAFAIVQFGIARPLGRLVSELQGMARGERMDLIVQKATELGVHAIRPLRASRSSVKLDATQGPRKLEHWRGVSISAAGQCGRADVPEILPPRRLPEHLALAPSTTVPGMTPTGEAPTPL